MNIYKNVWIVTELLSIIAIPVLPTSSYTDYDYITDYLGSTEDSQPGGSSQFDTIFSTISGMAVRAKNTFSKALLPRTEERGNKRIQGGSKRIITKFARPLTNNKIQGINKFQEPPMEKITQVSLGPDGLHSPFLQNRFSIPGAERHQHKAGGNLIRNSGDAEKFNARIAEKLKKLLRKLNQETTPATATFSSLSSSKSSPTVSPRSFSVTPIDNGRFQVDPITISSTPGSFRIIQPIQIVSTTAPRVQSQTFSSIFPLTSSSSFLTTTPRPSFKPITFPNQSPRSRFPSQSARPRFPSQSSQPRFPSQSQQPRFPKQQSLSLSFEDNSFSSLGQQVSTDPLSGFPDGLPEETPLGVRLSLENMLGAAGELMMNPIPGVAGIDYPIYSYVPGTDFICSQQEYPGIYTDIEAGCQVFHMCPPSGQSASFLCPNGTIFSQQYFVCDWWYNLDCAQQQDWRYLNQFLYQDQGQQGAGCDTLFCSQD